MSGNTARDLAQAVREFVDAYRPVLRSFAAHAERVGFPPGHARVLCALGHSPVTCLTDLRDRLGIDAGQLSRTVRQLSAAGAVTVLRCSTDRRRRTIQLTDLGLHTCRRLDAAYDEAIRIFLGRPPDTEQHGLVMAMNTVRDALDSTAQLDAMA
jgi:DNA-binding MarR family transcriptional regulator